MNSSFFYGAAFLAMLLCYGAFFILRSRGFTKHWVKPLLLFLGTLNLGQLLYGWIGGRVSAGMAGLLSVIVLLLCLQMWADLKDGKMDKKYTLVSAVAAPLLIMVAGGPLYALVEGLFFPLREGTQVVATYFSAGA